MFLATLSSLSSSSFYFSLFIEILAVPLMSNSRENIQSYPVRKMITFSCGFRWIFKKLYCSCGFNSMGIFVSHLTKYQPIGNVFHMHKKINILTMSCPIYSKFPFKCFTTPLIQPISANNFVRQSFASKTKATKLYKKTNNRNKRHIGIVCRFIRIRIRFTLMKRTLTRSIARFIYIAGL